MVPGRRRPYAHPKLEYITCLFCLIEVFCIEIELSWLYQSKEDLDGVFHRIHKIFNYLKDLYKLCYYISIGQLIAMFIQVVSAYT